MTSRTRSNDQSTEPGPLHDPSGPTPFSGAARLDHRADETQDRIVPMIDPALRFTSRVENYARYRPGYPAGVVESMREKCGLTPASIVADIGSGTGILSELFLRNGNTVYGVEPDREMRLAGERLLHCRAGFRSVAGRAEATTLAAGSVDFIVAGQAFHWFDQDRARAEFLRILRPSGWVMLVWNERDTRRTPFLMDYERVLRRHAIDYEQVGRRRVQARRLDGFYGESGFWTREFHHRQTFDHDGLVGRVLSASYAPEPGHPAYLPMLAELERLFQNHQVDGAVAFDYTTNMYCGRLDS